MPIGVVLLLCFFSKNVVECFPLEPMTYLVSSPLSVSGTSSISWRGPLIHRIVVGFPHIICATTALVYLEGKLLLCVSGFVAG